MIDRRMMLAALGGVLAAGAARAHDGHAHREPAAGGARRLEGRYAMPHAPLTDEAGVRVDLAQALDRPGPVLMNFIYTTCPGICPVLSAVFAETAAELGPDLRRTRFWSVSIDPDYDTPERLRAYAAQFDAPPEWRFFTGPPAAVNAVRDAFDALDDIKMAHSPLILLRRSGDAWLRFEGWTTPAESLAAEVRAALALG